MRRPDWPARLEGVAEVEATRLARAGALAVALTGSLARQDAAEGSDVDLWVIGKARRRTYREVSGVPVTLLRETVQQVFSLELFSRVEVLAARPLYDPLGIFKKLKASYRRHAKAARQRTQQGLEHELKALRAAAVGAEPVLKLLLLREVLELEVSRLALVRWGFIAVKLRHLPRLLPAPTRRDFIIALGLSPKVAAASAEQLRHLPGPGLASVRAKLEHGLVADAVRMGRLGLRLGQGRKRRPLYRVLAQWHTWRSAGARRARLDLLLGLSPRLLAAQLRAAQRAAFRLESRR